MEHTTTRPLRAFGGLFGELRSALQPGAGGALDWHAAARALELMERVDPARVADEVSPYVLAQLGRGGAATRAERPSHASGLLRGLRDGGLSASTRACTRLDLGLALRSAPLGERLELLGALTGQLDGGAAIPALRSLNLDRIAMPAGRDDALDALLLSLADGPAATRLHTLSFTSSTTDSPGRSHPTVDAALLERLAQSFTGLRALKLTGHHLDHDCGGALARARWRLERLSLDASFLTRCLYPPATLHEVLRHACTPALRALSFVQDEQGDPERARLALEQATALGDLELIGLPDGAALDALMRTINALPLTTLALGERLYAMTGAGGEGDALSHTLRALCTKNLRALTVQARAITPHAQALARLDGARLEQLTLLGHIQPEAFATLTAASWWGGLRQLTLGAYGDAPPPVEALPTLLASARLTHLDLSGVSLPPGHLRVMAGAPGWAGLRSLALRFHEDTAEDWLDTLASTLPAHLHTLTLRMERGFTPPGRAAGHRLPRQGEQPALVALHRLFHSPRCAGLRVLDIARVPAAQDAHVESLVSGPAAPTLQVLRATHCQLTRRAAQTIDDAHALPALRGLVLPASIPHRACASLLDTHHLSFCIRPIS